MMIAITRAVSRAIARCELTHISRTPIDPIAAAAQHGEYEKRLAGLGCRVMRLPEEPDLPDSVFVEDAAVVFDELAVITRPGAASRQPETASVAAALQPYRNLAYITSPATLDGGDVLRVGRKVFIGLSRRTSQAGIRQMTDLLAPYGYSVCGVSISDCLHLKTAVTQVAENTLLINRQWVDDEPFRDMQMIGTDAAEPSAGNALLIGSTVLYPAEYPATRRRLTERGIEVITVPAAELARAEGGVTCCSLIFTER